LLNFYLGSVLDRMAAGSMAHRLAVAETSTLAGAWGAEREPVAALYKVFTGNARELLTHFARHASTSAAFDLRDPTRPGRSRAFRDETGRLLHNCLAAAASFADRATEVWKIQAAQNSSVSEEFEQCVDGLVTNSPLARFLCGLSKMSADGHLPLLSGKIEFVAGGRAGRCCVTALDPELLHAWDGWDTRAEEYLRQNDETVRLDALVAAYAASVEEFNRWLSRAWAEPATDGELSRETTGRPARSFPPLELM
jgi:hypothetical protein